MLSKVDYMTMLSDFEHAVNIEHVVQSEHVTKLDKFASMQGMSTFGEKLRALRESSGVSTWAVEKLTGIPRTNLSSIEKGRRPASEDVLRKLASIPELNIDYVTLKAWKVLDDFSPDELGKGLLKRRGEDVKTISSLVLTLLLLGGAAWGQWEGDWYKAETTTGTNYFTQPDIIDFQKYRIWVKRFDKNGVENKNYYEVNCVEKSLVLLDFNSSYYGPFTDILQLRRDLIGQKQYISPPSVFLTLCKTIEEASPNE